MSALYYLAIILAAPIYYWIAGAAIASLRKPTPWTGANLALVGVLAHGFLGEVSLIVRVNYDYLIVIMVGAITAVTLIRRRTIGPLLPSIWPFLFCYLIAVMAASTALFPIPGPWSGDWFENYRLGQSVLHGLTNSDLAGRTPIFGSASLPIARLTDGLSGLQILNAITCAAAVMALRNVLKIFVEDEKRINGATLLLCLSGVYLQHAGFPWAKMLAAGCLFAAIRSHSVNSTTGFLASSFWLAAAIAAHQAAFLFVPVVWCAQFMLAGPVNLGWWMQRVITLGIAGLLIVFPYEIFTVSVFGLQEKVHRNPTLYFRQENIGFIRNTIEVLVNSFVPDPRFFAEVWTNPKWDFSLRQTVTRIFFTDLYYITSVAGTFVLALLPFSLAGGFLRRLRATRIHLTSRQIIFLTTIAAAIIGNALLSAYTSPVGTAQAGLSPLVLAAVGAAALFTQGDRPAYLRPALTMFSMQTLPWFVLQGALLFVVQRSDRSQPDGAWMRLFDGDTDFHTAIEHFNGTLALHIFPLQIALLALAVVMWKKMTT